MEPWGAQVSRLLIIFFIAAPTVAQANPASDYKTQCAACHGESGAGDGPASASLPIKPASFQDASFWASRTDAQVRTAIAAGGSAVDKSPLMPPIGADWTEAQLDAMVAYLKTLKVSK